MAEPTRPDSAFEPLHRYFRARVFFGGLLAASAIGYAAGIGGRLGYFLPSLGLGVGGRLLFQGIRGLRQSKEGPVLSAANNLFEAGKLAAASALLDGVEEDQSPFLVWSRENLRARIALSRGDLDGALRHAEQAIGARSDASKPWAHGLATRAVLLAAKGHLERAMADVEAIRAAPESRAQTRAEAALAEAMVLERRGDHAALAEALRRWNRRQIAFLDMRERALLRAMQKLVKARPRNVYRIAAAPIDVGASEPTIAEWMTRVAPDLAAFAPAASASESSPEGAAPPVLQTSEKARERARRARTIVPSRAAPRRVAILWLVLLASVGVLWLCSAKPDLTAPLTGSPLWPASGHPLSATWGALVALWPALRFLRAKPVDSRPPRDMDALGDRALEGEDVDAELASAAADPRPTVAVYAELLRAHVAERRMRFEEGLAQMDRARSLLRTASMLAWAGSLIEPLITGTRAHLLAALGRSSEAAAELEHLPPDFVFLDRTRFEVHLVALVARGRIDEAGRLVEATPLDLPIAPLDELIRDLVRAVTAPDAAGGAEIARLRDDLREDEEARAWIERVAPELLARFEEAAPIEEDGEEEDGAAEPTAEE